MDVIHGLLVGTGTNAEGDEGRGVGTIIKVSGSSSYLLEYYTTYEGLEGCSMGAGLSSSIVTAAPKFLTSSASIVVSR